MARRSGLALAAIDLLGSLFLVALVMMAPPPKPASAIDTAGAYAVVLTWPRKDHADVDLWVRGPDGSVVSYNNKVAGGMHLEEDDIPGATGYLSGRNFERTVVRVPMMGEYTVNVHVYQKLTSGATAVWVVLWRLAGDDRVLLKQRLVMRAQGDERTAFRFRLKRDGSYGGFNRLPTSLVK